MFGLLFLIAPKLVAILIALFLSGVYYLILQRGTMDTTKWRSIAIRVETHKLLRALAEDSFRTPEQQIAKLLDNHIAYKAQKERIKKYDLLADLLKKEPDK